MIIENITQKPVKTQWEWVEKTVTTTPPKYIPHQEYSWRCSLSSENKIYGVVLLYYKNITRFQKFYSEDARCDLEVKLTFFPHNLNNSNLVLIILGQRINSGSSSTSLNIEDKMLKEDPRSIVDIHIPKESTLFTGNLIHLATVRSVSAVNAKLLIIDKNDTEITHGRWRLKSTLRKNLPAELKYLNEGRLAGELNI